MIDVIERKIPPCIISLCLISPVPKTIAFGGVATGMINAQLAPIPITIVRVSAGNPVAGATLANTGTRRAADAVLLVNSVKEMINTVTIKIIMNLGAPPTDRKSVV